jgi:hypothetical protein
MAWRQRCHAHPLAKERFIFILTMPPTLGGNRLIGSEQMMKQVVVMLVAVGLSGCAFVKMAPGAKQVRVLASAPSGCEKRGEVEVSITHRVGFYERSSTRVRDELETLARNEAPGLSANRISPLGEPNDGSQRWAMWRCS